ncbi:hypothetical protein UJ101_01213 [Flavobacteriaceae bacterium UJ101]|nr:hypothetical protein UJ101_01213 [Flavobacteriaceae bacterium UJ101]
MRKSLFLLSITLVFLFITSCSSDDDTSAVPASTSKASLKLNGELKEYHVEKITGYPNNYSIDADGNEYFNPLLEIQLFFDDHDPNNYFLIRVPMNKTGANIAIDSQVILSNLYLVSDNFFGGSGFINNIIENTSTEVSKDVYSGTIQATFSGTYRNLNDKVAYEITEGTLNLNY